MYKKQDPGPESSFPLNLRGLRLPQVLRDKQKVNMFFNRIGLFSAKLPLMSVVCLVAIVCSNYGKALATGTTGSGRFIGQQGLQRHTSGTTRGTALDKEPGEFIWTESSIQGQDLSFLLRTLCSRHPHECQSGLNRDWDAPSDLGRESHAYETDDGGSALIGTEDSFATATSKSTDEQQQRRVDRLLKAGVSRHFSRRTNATNMDEPISLVSSVFVTPAGEEKKATRVGETVGGQEIDQEGELDDHQMTASTTGMPPSRNANEQEDVRRMQPIKWADASWLQRVTRRPPSTYRVTLEEAKRFIKAQEQQQLHANFPLSNSLLLATSSVLDNQYNRPLLQQRGILQVEQHRQQQQQQDRRNLPRITHNNHEHSTSRGPLQARLHRGELLLVPKRAHSSPSSSQPLDQEPEGDIERADSTSASTSVQQDQMRVPTNSSAERSPPSGGGADDDAIKCNLRHFTYKATKSDGLGNQCTGLVTAAICYGGCDTGEIADWLFPHKKSIHKVCRHGGRVRRRTLLGYCTSSSGSELSGHEVPADLREYYHVDARDCVCKRCTSIDTTCLGTMSKPHLQTMGEAAAELGQNQQQLAAIAGGD